MKQSALGGCKQGPRYQRYAGPSSAGPVQAGSRGRAILAGCMRGTGRADGRPSQYNGFASNNGPTGQPFQPQHFAFVDTPKPGLGYASSRQSQPNTGTPAAGTPASQSPPWGGPTQPISVQGDETDLPINGATRISDAQGVGVSVGSQTDSSMDGSPSPSPSPARSQVSNGNSEPVQGPTAEETVAAALARAQEALTKVESSLESIEDLPSNKPPSKLAALFNTVKTAVVLGVLSTALVASHAFGLGVQWSSAMLGAVGIAWWGYSRGALAVSGAMAALLVGAGTLGCSLRFGATLLAFYISSSKLTVFKEEMKEGLDDAAKAGGQRDWKQVLCNAAIPTAIAITYGMLLGCVDVPMGLSPRMEVWRAKVATLLGGAFLGYYACCCGDTWASELGPLSSDTPRLITSMRPVRRGTNGGVTLLGLSASILGGMFVGAVFYCAALVSPTLWILEGQQAAAVGQWRLVPLGLIAGLLGSVLDSLLGATLQFSGYNRLTGRVTSKPGAGVVHISGMPFLDNNMVNLLSASITAGLTALAALQMFF